MIVLRLQFTGRERLMTCDNDLPEGNIVLVSAGDP